MTETLMIVKMTKRYGSNYPGELCGFPTSLAKKLVDSGAAEIMRPDVERKKGAAELAREAHTKEE